MNLHELANFNLPTAKELKAQAPKSAEQWVSSKKAFSWDKLERFVACRAVGISVLQAAAAAGFGRGSWYSWTNEETETGQWLEEIADEWQGFGASAFAARVAVLTDPHGDPNVAGTNARWMAERTSTAHAPAPKREVVTAQADDHGAKIVIEHMDGIVQPPDIEETEATE